jgi:hypothetical protein
VEIVERGNVAGNRGAGRAALKMIVY